MYLDMPPIHNTVKPTHAPEPAHLQSNKTKSKSIHRKKRAAPSQPRTSSWSATEPQIGRGIGSLVHLTVSTSMKSSASTTVSNSKPWLPHIRDTTKSGFRFRMSRLRKRWTGLSVLQQPNPNLPQKYLSASSPTWGDVRDTHTLRAMAYPSRFAHLRLVHGAEDRVRLSRVDLLPLKQPKLV